MVKRKLGRGLQALLGVEEDSEGAGGVDVGEADAGGELARLPLSELDRNPYQPRNDFRPEELAALTQSVCVHGVIQPIIVRPVGGRFQIIAGERRFRAAQEAGLTHIPVRVVDIDEQQTFEFALVENLQREDLNAIEKAQAFEKYINQFGTTHEELAGHLGVDRSTVTNFIRLLELPQAVQEAVRVGQISNGHARALLSVNDSVEQIALCRRIIAEGLSVRQTEEAVRGYRTAPDKPSSPAKSAPSKSNHLQSLENDLRQRLATKVEIKAKAKDKGTITIHFESHDDFERVMSCLTK